jgi:hypothetical protein
MKTDKGFRLGRPVGRKARWYALDEIAVRGVEKVVHAGVTEICRRIKVGED